LLEADLCCTNQLLRSDRITYQGDDIDCFCARWDTWLGQHVVYDLGKPMGLGNDLFQALLDSVRHRFVGECGRSEGEHRGN
jgi:hypothetical protein